MDYVEPEHESVSKHFDLAQVLAFTAQHEVQVIRGEDYQYTCYINREGWGLGLTFMGALVNGLRRWAQHNKTHNT